MGQIESVTYTHVEAGPTPPAAVKDKKLVIYALSTCGFCERSMKFLRAQGIGFDYIFIDQLEPWIKTGLKDELREKHGAATVFPYLVIDGKEIIVGFTEEKWRTGLGL
jgi:glutaredoxin